MIRTAKGEVTAWVVRGMLMGTAEASPEVAFVDGSPALASRPVGCGRITYFSWYPGLSYAKSASWGTFQQPPTGYEVRSWNRCAPRMCGRRRRSTSVRWSLPSCYQRAEQR